MIVEGIAASAASVIACAGDDVQVYPGSMIMIHGVSALLFDYYSLPDLKKLQKDFDASERAIAEIYHAKTGLEVDQLRAMMTRETWMVGHEAVNNGFADTLLDEDENFEAAISADKKVLLVAGVRHDVTGFKNLPGSIPVSNKIRTTKAAENKKTVKKDTKEVKTMTAEELRAEHGDIIAQIERDAAEEARTTAITEERARLQAIEEIEASVGDTQMIHDAKYGENPMTAEQLALAAMKKQAQLGAQHLANVKDDNAASQANGVAAAPNGGEEGSETDDKAKVDAIVGLYNSTKTK